MAEDSTSPTKPSEAATETGGRAKAAGNAVFQFQVNVTEGPQSGLQWVSTGDRCVIGTHPSCELILDDPTVSRFHCEILLGTEGARIRDLGSKNGTLLDSVRVIDGYLRGGSLLRIGCTLLRFNFGEETNQLPLSSNTSFGSLVGTSLLTRVSFALLERAAETNATVLIEGETGTGKEGAAAAIHEHSARKEGPFVVVDCGAIPKDLLESELFGHEKGAFTGAALRRIGAFEEASGGTIVLDEIGELSLDLQPKLLRVLEQREVRRVGSNGYIPVDVRVIAATNRDLRAEVNAGRFRSDLYYRLAVLKVALPPLRARPEDFPIIVRSILESLDADVESVAAFTAHDFVGALQAGSWPGNVRELRNHLERCLVMKSPLPPQDSAADGGGASGVLRIDGHVRYEEARQRALEQFERHYVESLLAIHHGNVAQAARAAGISRVYLYRLMRRAGTS